MRLFRYIGKVRPPLKKPHGLKCGWLFYNGMATTVPNVVIPIICTRIISALLEKADQPKWTT
jgi:hypothetical protein